MLLMGGRWAWCEDGIKMNIKINQRRGRGVINISTDFKKLTTYHESVEEKLQSLHL